MTLEILLLHTSLILKLQWFWRSWFIFLNLNLKRIHFRKTFSSSRDWAILIQRFKLFNILICSIGVFSRLMHVNLRRMFFIRIVFFLESLASRIHVLLVVLHRHTNFFVIYIEDRVCCGDVICQFNKIRRAHIVIIHSIGMNNRCSSCMHQFFVRLILRLIPT